MGWMSKRNCWGWRKSATGLVEEKNEGLGLRPLNPTLGNQLATEKAGRNLGAWGRASPPYTALAGEAEQGKKDSKGLAGP